MEIGKRTTAQRTAVQRAAAQKAGKGGIHISLDRARTIYESAKRNPAYANKILAPSFVRIEAKILNGRTKYEFPFTRDTNSDTVTERKIDRKDLFLMTHMGLFLMKRDSTKLGGEVLQTYPNIIVFPNDSTNFLGADLEVFYNGAISVKVGQTVYIEGLDTRQFRSVEENIQSSTIDKSAERSNSGLIELTPQLTLDGNQKNEIVLEAPVSGSAKVENTVANMSNYLVLFGRGFLITSK